MGYKNTRCHYRTCFGLRNALVKAMPAESPYVKHGHTPVQLLRRCAIGIERHSLVTLSIEQDGSYHLPDAKEPASQHRQPSKQEAAIAKEYPRRDH
jgi:hypothetical protein